ncbi:unnamed protein product [Rangifer tarandus platyrhynchus]|uniref:Uncharacterized protein n=2 Tax=Rangifer tarandus platyrhynchus TaxID=3082113 RepID=A0AC60A853_RANTA|nr:unnamed protein product [Rangifer tarandus platyrhynchus]
MRHLDLLVDHLPIFLYHVHSCVLSKAFNVTTCLSCSSLRKNERKREKLQESTSGTVAHQASLSMGFSRQEYWSGLPFSSPEDLPDPGIEPESPALVGGSFTMETPGKLISLPTRN